MVLRVSKEKASALKGVPWRVYNLDPHGAQVESRVVLHFVDLDCAALFG